MKATFLHNARFLHKQAYLHKAGKRLVGGKRGVMCGAEEKLVEAVAKKQLRFGDAWAWIEGPGVFEFGEWERLLHTGAGFGTKDPFVLVTVRLRWPHLELINGRVRHHSRICGEDPASFGEVFAIVQPAKVPKRCQNEL